jgi:hypothetical protein
MKGHFLRKSNPGHPRKDGSLATSKMFVTWRLGMAGFAK